MHIPEFLWASACVTAIAKSYVVSDSLLFVSHEGKEPKKFFSKLLHCILY